MTTLPFTPSTLQITFLGSGTGKLFSSLTLSPKTALLLEDYSSVTPRFQLNLTLSLLGILLPKGSVVALPHHTALTKNSSGLWEYPQTTPATLVHSAIYTVLRIGETSNFL